MTDKTRTLLGALADGDLTRALELLAMGADPNEINSEGHTALHVFARGLPVVVNREHWTVFDALLNHGGNLEIRDGKGALAEDYASMADNLNSRTFRAYRSRKALLASDPSLDLRGANGWAALHWAARENDVGQIDRQLTGGANPNQGDDKGNPPIFIAAAHGNADALSALFGWGGDQWKIIRNRRHRNILHAAVEGGVFEVARRVDQCIQDTEEESRPVLYTEPDADGFTPLHMAAIKGPAEILKLFSSRCGSEMEPIDAYNRRGETALAAAARRPGNWTACRVLLDAGADPMCCGPDALDGPERTPLVCAVWSGDPRMVRNLLKAGAKFSAGAFCAAEALMEGGAGGPKAQAIYALLSDSRVPAKTASSGGAAEPGPEPGM